MNDQPISLKPAATGQRQRFRDNVRFLFEWIKNPRGVAAVAPSGEALAALITREIKPSMGVVLELGPGTGVFTSALLNRGVLEEELVLVEMSPLFASLLKARYPRATVLNVDASKLEDYAGYTKHQYGAVICGLGLLNMEPDAVEAIVSGAFARMAPEAAMYLFTYGRSCSIPQQIMNDLNLEAVRVGTTLRNLPPASVYRVTRRASVGVRYGR